MKLEIESGDMGVSDADGTSRILQSHYVTDGDSGEMLGSFGSIVEATLWLAAMREELETRDAQPPMSPEEEESLLAELRRQMGRIEELGESYSKPAIYAHFQQAARTISRRGHSERMAAFLAELRRRVPPFFGPPQPMN